MAIGKLTRNASEQGADSKLHRIAAGYQTRKHANGDAAGHRTTVEMPEIVMPEP